MNLDGYVVGDDFFGTPFVDIDEERTDPLPHRYVHGGFAGTDTLFSCYFPPAEIYRHRLMQPIEGGLGGQEGFHGTPVADLLGMGMRTVFHLGGYMVESNQGHRGPTPCAKAGDDPTIYGYRASAESARLSKHLAAEVYGRPPDHAYLYGGGGGAHRGAQAFTNTDVWDGAYPFDGAGPVGEVGATSRVAATGWGQYGAWLDVLRVLGPKVADLVDATLPGGRGDPFVGLGVEGREALATLYRMGFPRGAEPMIPWASAPMSVWAWSADTLDEQDPGYVDAFWTEPGYAGHDRPEDFADDLVDIVVTVRRVLSAADVLTDDRFEGSPGAMRAGFYPPESMLAVEIDGLRGNALGAAVEVVDGAATGRRLYCNSSVGAVVFADAVGDAGVHRFQGVAEGDRIRLDNRAFLAFCHYHRHHAGLGEPGYESFFVDGAAVFPQRPPIIGSPFVGGPKAATFGGKMLWAQYTHDSSVWPGAIVPYDRAVRDALGANAAQRWCLRYTEHAENLPPIMIGGTGTSSAQARVIDWSGQVEQGLADLVEWVEDDVTPAATNFRFDDGRLVLPASAAERGGIQAVVHLTADGRDRAEIALGETVRLDVDAEVPDGQGAIILLEWDPEGTGSWTPAERAQDGTASRIVEQLSCSYSNPGTYIAGVRVTSHRTGDVGASFGRVVNLGRARVVVG